MYARPSWQDSFITTYFNTVKGTNKVPISGYSIVGRGYPDVSLLGHSYVIVAGGATYEVDGTSASTPVMAALTSLVNAARKQQGLSTIGWLNPTLYYYYSSFIHDITAGNNNCTANNGLYVVCCSQGFYATNGWDPVTGLGSVMFDAFLATLANATNLENTDYDDLVMLDTDDTSTVELSLGVIVGIAIGCTVGVSIIVFLVYWIVGKCQLSRTADGSSLLRENEITKPKNIV
jgi:hypothetical protein